MNEDRKFKPLPMNYACVIEINQVSIQFKVDKADEKSARLSLLPSGTAAHRVLLKGVLQSSTVTDGSISAVFRDRTGKITLRASSEFQPLAFSKLKALKDLPQFVAVTARVNLFFPESDSGKERQIYVSLNLEDIGLIGKPDRENWDPDVLRLTRDRCAWSEELTAYQQMAREVYGLDCEKTLLESIEAAYTEAGVPI